jgi:hypothetical protein
MKDRHGSWRGRRMDMFVDGRGMGAIKTNNLLRRFSQNTDNMLAIQGFPLIIWKNDFIPHGASSLFTNNEHV